MSRARSAEVITTAPPPSLTTQQSSRCSGDEMTRDVSTSSTVIGSRYLPSDSSTHAGASSPRSPPVARRSSRIRACGAARSSRTTPRSSARTESRTGRTDRHRRHRRQCRSQTATTPPSIRRPPRIRRTARRDRRGRVRGMRHERRPANRSRVDEIRCQVQVIAQADDPHPAHAHSGRDNPLTSLIVIPRLPARPARSPPLSGTDFCPARIE